MISALNGCPQRFVDNGDGTATDRSTGLLWEIKTGELETSVPCPDIATCPDPHDVNNVYTWCGDGTDLICDDGMGPFDGGAKTAFLDVLNDVTEDFWETGNGYFEIVREAPGGPITGIHHLPAHKPIIFVEDADYNFHYEILDDEGSSTVRRFARFADGADFLTRATSETLDFTLPPSSPRLHLRQVLVSLMVKKKSRTSPLIQ